MATAGGTVCRLGLTMGLLLLITTPDAMGKKVVGWQEHAIRRRGDKGPVQYGLEDMADCNTFRSMVAYYAAQLVGFMDQPPIKSQKSFGPKHAVCRTKLKEVFYCIAANDPYNVTKWSAPAVYKACPKGWEFGSTPVHQLFSLSAFKQRSQYNYGMAMPIGAGAFKLKLESLQHRLSAEEKWLKASQSTDESELADSKFDIAFIKKEIRRVQHDFAEFNKAGSAEADDDDGDDGGDSDDDDGKPAAKELKDLSEIDSPFLDAYKSRYQSILNALYLAGWIIGTMANALTKPPEQMDVMGRALIGLLMPDDISLNTAGKPTDVGPSSNSTPASLNTTATPATPSLPTSLAKTTSYQLTNFLVQAPPPVTAGAGATVGDVGGNAAGVDVQGKQNAAQAEADRADGLAPPEDAFESKAMAKSKSQQYAHDMIVQAFPASIRSFIDIQCKAGGLCDFEKAILYFTMVAFCVMLYAQNNVSESMFSSRATTIANFDQQTDVGDWRTRLDFQGLIPMWLCLIMLGVRIPIVVLQTTHQIQERAKDPSVMITCGVEWLVILALDVMTFMGYYDNLLERIHRGQLPMGTGKEWMTVEQVSKEFMSYSLLHRGLIEDEPLFLETNYVEHILKQTLYSEQKDCPEQVVKDIAHDLVTGITVCPKFQSMIVYNTWMCLCFEAHKGAAIEFVMREGNEMMALGHELLAMYGQVMTQYDAAVNTESLLALSRGLRKSKDGGNSSSSNTTNVSKSLSTSMLLQTQSDSTATKEEIELLKKALSRDETKIAQDETIIARSETKMAQLERIVLEDVARSHHHHRHHHHDHVPSGGTQDVAGVALAANDATSKKEEGAGVTQLL